MPETRPHPRFNHVALTVPGDLLDARGRDEILRFHGEVFGWTEMPTLTRDRELLVLRAWSHEQFVFLAASEAPLRGDGSEHFGIRPDAPTFSQEASACSEFEGLVNYSVALQEAYHSRATQNRFWIYAAGTVALGTVAATGAQ